jgi:hypothetical protein
MADKSLRGVGGNSIWRRSLDLLYGMCDSSNAKDIVNLSSCRFPDLFLIKILLVMCTNAAIYWGICSFFTDYSRLSHS